VKFGNAPGGRGKKTAGRFGLEKKASDLFKKKEFDYYKEKSELAVFRAQDEREVPYRQAWEN